MLHGQICDRRGRSARLELVEGGSLAVRRGFHIERSSQKRRKELSEVSWGVAKLGLAPKTKRDGQTRSDKWRVREGEGGGGERGDKPTTVVVVVQFAAPLVPKNLHSALVPPGGGGGGGRALAGVR
mmetsp:Transcript_29927/g.53539  ORF Transcript_29927/g.53539 Transcript_29927/m.53539 type:complete len:126 (+) Transcript_29927:1214-1591(+)